MRRKVRSFSVLSKRLAGLAILLLGAGAFTACDPDAVQVIAFLDSASQNTGYIEGAGTYTKGDTITLTAVANGGYVFAHWFSGDNESAVRAANTYLDRDPLTISEAEWDSIVNNIDEEDLSALYSEDNITNPYTFVGEQSLYVFMASFIDTADQHSIRITAAANDPNINVTGSGLYELHSQVTLTAPERAEGKTFVSWNDGNRNTSRTITVSHNRTYVALYKQSEEK